MRQVNNAFFQVKMEGNWRNGEMDFKLKNFIFIEPISLKFRQLFIKVLDCLDNKVGLWFGLAFSLIHFCSPRQILFKNATQMFLG